MRDKYFRIIEVVLMSAGLVLVAFFVAAHLHRSVLSQAAVERFKVMEKQSTHQKNTDPFANKQFGFDFTLWSTDRIAAYKDTLTREMESPLAVLRIRKVRLEVPVLSGTDDLTLNRGVGLLPAALPGQRGNIAIAGHRDGFFRVLKDVGPGDIIELENINRIDIYRVQRVVIVRPDDVSVLSPTSIPTLTLITCYPFYFIGSAPKRYIVQASLVDSGRPAVAEQQQNTSSVRFKPAPQDANLQSRKTTKEITQ